MRKKNRISKSSNGTMFLRQIMNNTTRLAPNLRAMSSQEPLVDLTVDNHGISIMTLQRPPVNSLNLELLNKLSQLLDEVAKNISKGLIITSGHAPGSDYLLSMSTEYRVMVEGKFSIGLKETALGILVSSWFIDSVCHIISVRQAEIAVTTATMLTVDEALKGFINKFDKIPALTRSTTKQRVGQHIINRFKAGREADLQEFLEFLQIPQVQEILGVYIQLLKNKAAK